MNRKSKKSYKTYIAMGLAIMVLLMASACGKKTEESFETTEALEAAAITDGIVSCFLPLAEIPRPSHFEEAISDYLFNWAEERGFDPYRDEANNVIFDVPATPGKEEVSGTILQAHMDMVVAVADGKTFDPLKDGITVINDGKKLTADGTSLGADNGIGIAAILYFIENSTDHGPLRIIFTTDEEDLSTGALALTTSVTDGMKYVINLDSEEPDAVTTSSAAGVSIYFSADYALASPASAAAIGIKISKLKSGHSGSDIHKGRLNGIKAAGEVLKNLEDAGIGFELSLLKSGTANNIIPDSVEAVLVVDEAAVAAAKENISKTFELLESEYGAVETEIETEIWDSELPEKVLGRENTNKVVKLVSGIFDGVNTMSKEVEGLVESSSNIGIIALDTKEDGLFFAETFVRSSTENQLEELVKGQLNLAEECEIFTVATETAAPWPVKTDSKLLEIVKSSYKKQTGEDIRVIQIHAGLETGYFARLDPDLDIVAIGFEITDGHTIKEACNLETFADSYLFFEDVMANLE